MLKPTIAIFLVLKVFDGFSQCSTIRQQRDISFNTDKDCAPVTVTNFTITYFFNVAQDPNDITIRFDWNDPGNTVNDYDNGDAVFVASAGNTAFTATGTFTYPQNNSCSFEPISSLLVNGTECETSRQPQTVTSWARDNNFGGTLLTDPVNFNVCYESPVTNAIFEDNSTFNCNPDQDPDNPNRLERHTQFVYGTGHVPATSIRNLTLEDGGTVNLTDNAGNLSSSTTVNGITAAYFGPIVNIPFPADEPNMTSFPMNAPADPNNLVGYSFEITLFNWNICNPYNGNPANPNYADAEMTTATITIVDPPVPDFQTRLDNASGNLQTIFCLGETIYFENLTGGGGFGYTWEFYDDPTGTTLLNTSNASNPTYVYNTPGDKLIRLYANDAAAQGDCEKVIEKVITLSPAAIAQIGTYDASFSGAITPDFCSDGSGNITLGFRDETTSVESDTRWRWEFFDENNAFVESFIAGEDTAFTRSYVDQGEHRVVLIARNIVTQCETRDEVVVRLYDIPEVSFEVAEVCAGERTPLTAIADSLTSLGVRVNNDHVNLYEWDFSYDGTFIPERTSPGNNDFNFFLDGNDLNGGAEPSTSVAGTYSVALRMTTANGCNAVSIEEAVVNPLPVPVLSSDYSGPLCPDDLLTFFNNSDLVSADYQLIITDSLTIADTLVFNTTDTIYTFPNTATTSRFFYAHLYALTPELCDSLSSPTMIEVLPSAVSGFSDPDYTLTTGNCSLWESTLVVNNATQALNADQYTWTISNTAGILPGYPVVKLNGDPDFHELGYTLENATPQNQLFTVFLEVEKAGICIEPSEREFVINPAPNGDFTTIIADSCTYKRIVLEASQKSLPGYHWVFDPVPDQLLDENDRQTLIYTRRPVGTPDESLNFSLVTENLAECTSDTVSTQLQLEALEESISAGFTAEPDTLILPENTVNIQNNSTTGTGLSYTWDFDDGFTSSVYDPGAHLYEETGNYRIVLRVSNRFCEEEAFANVVVQPANPLVDFETMDREGCNPLTVQFSNTSEYAESGTYFWDFGDGRTSTADEPAHTYTRPGLYTVRLYGENRLGRGSEALKHEYIEVFPQPVANFALSPQTVYIPDQVVYFRNSTENADSYYWDFGDGYSSELENPTHGYSSVGSYDITLIASNTDGCADTLTLLAAVEAVIGGTEETPNAFSPGSSESANGGSGDAVNDVFLPRVEGVSAFRMLIYNKWGELLFESTSQTEGWNGYYKGRLQPSDVYVYKLELTFSDGRKSVKVGDVTLVR